MVRIEKEARESRRKVWRIALGITVFCAASVELIGGVAATAVLATLLAPAAVGGSWLAALGVAAIGGAITGATGNLVCAGG